MPLRLRRGTDAERLTITPAEGELIYTTDLKRVYVGDGTTVGGVQLTVESVIDNLNSNLDLNGFNIVGPGNIDINGDISTTGIITGTIDGTVIGNVEGDVKGSLFGDDSSVLVDSLSNTHYGLFDGNLIGNVTGNTVGLHTGNVIGDVTGNLAGTVFGTHFGNVEGDLSGSVLSNNSSLIIDGVTGFIYTRRIFSTENILQIFPTTPSLQNSFVMNTDDEQSLITLRRRSSGDISGPGITYGSLTFQRSDINGFLTGARVIGGENFINFIANTTGLTTNTQDYLSWTDKKLGVGTNTPTSTLDVNGNALISGSLEAASLQGPLLSIDSSVIVATNGFIYTRRIFSTDNALQVFPTTSSTQNSFVINADDAQSLVTLRRRSSGDISGPGITYGSLTFQRSDINGFLTGARVIGGENFINFIANTTGLTTNTDEYMSWTDKKLGVGTDTPTATLDVRGNAKVSGDLEAAAFKGSIVGDDSSVIVDAVNSTIAVSGFIQFGSYTKTDRDNLVAGNGMVLYNTTSNRFQGYQNGAWINLDDGTADP